MKKNLCLALIMISTLLINSLGIRAQVITLEGISSDDSSRAEDMMSKIVRLLPKQIGSNQLTIKTAVFSISNYSAMYTGMAEVSGMGEVSYRALFNSTDSLSNFQINFPLSARIKPPSFQAFNKVVSGINSFYLPSFIRDRMVMDSFDIKWHNSGVGLESTYFGIKIMEDWQLFDGVDIKFSKIALGFITNYPDKDAEQSFKMAGNLTAYAKWRDTEISLGSTLSKDIKDWVISAELRTFTIEDLLSIFHIDDIGAVFIPPVVLQQGTTKATLDIRPFKGVEFTALTSLGNLNILVERLTVDKKPMSTMLTGGYSPKPLVKNTEPAKLSTNATGAYIASETPPKPSTLATMLTGPYVPPTESKGHKWGLMAGFSLPEDFKFSTFLPALSPLDKFQAFNAGIYFSTFEAAPQNSLPIFKNLGSGNPTVYKGLTFIVGVNTAEIKEDFKFIEEMGWLYGIDFACFSGNIPANPANFTLTAGINLNEEQTSIGGRIYFPYIEIGLEPNAAGGREFSLSGFMNLKLTQKDILEFKAKASIDPGGMSANIGAALLNEWRNAFGIRGFSFGEMELGVGINFSKAPIPLPDDISLAGKLYFGKMYGKARIGIDVNEMAKNHFIGEINNVSWTNLIDYLFEEQVRIKIPNYLIPYFNSELKHAKIKFVPPAAGTIRTLTNETLTPGFGISGEGEIAGWGGKFDVALEGYESGINAGLKAYCLIDPIDISAGKLPLFKLSGANGKGKPELKVDITAGSILKAYTTLPSAGNKPVAYTAENSLVYINGGLTVLGASNANAFLALTPTGFKTTFDGKILGVMQASIDVEMKSIINPVTNTYLKAEAKQEVYDLVTKAVGEAIKTAFGNNFVSPFFKKGFSINRIYFEGFLEGLQTGVVTMVDLRVAGSNKTIKVKINADDAANFALAIAKQVLNDYKFIFDEIRQAFEKMAEEVKKAAENAAAAAKASAEKAVNLAKATTQNAISVADNLKGNLSAGAKTAYNSTKDGFVNVGRKTQQFFQDFGKYTKSTIEKLFNTSIDRLGNGWNSFTDAVKKAFTGGDNEERIMTNGPAFRIITRFQNSVLSSPASTRKNIAIIATARTGSYLQNWQLIPNDTEGSFYLVSGYSGLLIAKPWDTHLTLIPHESDHKKRERMVMEPVINEPGWYYLKYHSYDTKNNVNYYTYAEIKNVMVDRISQWVLAPVVYGGNNKPGEYGKFKFEKTSDIDWQRTKSFPPYMTMATLLTENGRYQFRSEPEQYIYTNGAFRWIPDLETLVAMKLDARPMIVLPNNQQVSTVLGPAYPSRKNGILIQAQGEPAVYIMENNTRRWIPDIETFNMLGVNPGMINFISKADLQAIPEGAPIPSRFKPRVVLQERALYQVTGDPAVYVVINRTLRHIPDPETLVFMGYNFGQIQGITLADFNTLSKGQMLATRRNGSMVQASGDPAVYYMENGIRRGIPDPETLNYMKLDWSKIQKLAPQDLVDIPIGPALLSTK
jgi:hypothetical protein